jgi:hemerythrin-like domain-containing protein
MPVQIGKKRDHGFDEPLGLLSDCHRRIERFLEIMLRVARSDRSSAPLSGASREAMEQALQYFRVAGPRHTADEEESLFPALRETPGPEAARLIANADALEQDHRDAERVHARADELVSRWLQRSLTEEEARELIDVLESLQRSYETHIGFEDRELFPAAARILAAAQLEAIGRQMAERRGLAYPTQR